MGLLSRAGLGAQQFMRGMGREMPDALSAPAMGAGLGGAIGGMANPDDPMAGAMMGAGAGALGGAGLAGGMVAQAAMRAPAGIAEQIIKSVPRGSWGSALDEVAGMFGPATAREVSDILNVAAKRSPTLNVYPTPNAFEPPPGMSPIRRPRRKRTT